MTLPNFDQLLDKYAHLLVRKGLNISQDDYLYIISDINQAPLVRKLTEHAYDVGARAVIVNWSDSDMTRLNYIGQSTETLTDIPQNKIDEAKDLLDKKAKRISIRSVNPNALAGVDTEKISATQKANAVAMEETRNATQANHVSWLVAAGAAPEWAALVFPGLESEEEQVDALWHEIFKATLVYEDDPIEAWSQHETFLEEKAAFLNNHQFDALHYSAPGTDLVVGLPLNHVWESAGSVNKQGETFIANMPTEEVFTAPDCRRIDGVVSSTKPLSYGGTVINQMVFEFKDGQVTKASAEEGEDTLLKFLENNEGAKSLGEVALVPHQSPISQSGVTFFNTLYDENASCHLALGSAYATSIQGGADMSREELEAHGLNNSTSHVDFMIGSDKMDIDGITKNGEKVPLFRQGEWVF